ncbi:hypothetical protein XENOCAPTIV_005894 [Xenoophorus captivus]|uniref:Uncharacterized protein n=1 Tax=Xenoophorus captivus TaxID=1517983 RepID=A0ABV0R4J5_9TELE
MIYCRYLFLKCCFNYKPDVKVCTPFRKVLSSVHNIFPNVFRIEIIFGKCETSLCVVLCQQLVSLGTLQWTPFLLSFSLLLLNHETLTEESEVWSASDVVLDSFGVILPG